MTYAPEYLSANAESRRAAYHRRTRRRDLFLCTLVVLLTASLSGAVIATFRALHLQMLAQ